MNPFKENPWHKMVDIEVSTFIANKCETGPYRVRSIDLFNEFKLTHSYSYSRKTFTGSIDRLGYGGMKSNGERYRVGLRLKPQS